MPIAFIGVGSNLGNREVNIQNAFEFLNSSGIKILKQSTIIETEPVGYLNQGKFLNGVIKVETALSPQELLLELKLIEKKLGRVKTIKDGPRVIDLDILLYDDAVLNLPNLIIPHPEIYERDFVLNPLMEIAPELLFPLGPAQGGARRESKPACRQAGQQSVGLDPRLREDDKKL